MNKVQAKKLTAPIEQSYSGQDVVRVIKGMFPQISRFGLSHLNYYKREGIISCNGVARCNSRGNSYDRYTFSDIVLIAWIMEMRIIGIPANSMRKCIAKFRVAIAPEAEFHQKIGPLTWSYPIGQLVTRVKARLSHADLH